MTSNAILNAEPNLVVNWRKNMAKSTLICMVMNMTNHVYFLFGLPERISMDAFGVNQLDHGATPKLQDWPSSIDYQIIKQ